MAVATFTYDVGDTTDLNRVRLYVGDTVQASAKFDDAEINDMLATETTVAGAVALGFEILASRAAEGFDFSADGSSMSRSQRYQHYIKQAARWRSRQRGAVVHAPIKVDGFSQDIDAEEVTNSSPQQADFYV